VVQQSAFGPDDGPPQVLLIAPPPVGKLSEFAEMFTGAAEKAARLGDYYRQVAAEKGCHFLNASEIVVPSEADGLHLDASEHEKLGLAVASKVQDIFSA
jgi:lysophospholipase L1-like esterase